MPRKDESLSVLRDADVCRFMERHGWDAIHARDGWGRTLLMRAARNGHSGQVFDLLALGADVDAQDEDGWTALHWAASHTGDPGTARARRCAAACRWLLRHRADLDKANHDGHTALMMAAAIRDHDTVRVVLEHGADPNLEDGDGRTAWDYAREEEALPVLATLREFGATPRW